ncbi:hypothetical protein [Streptomyces sp. SID3343]|uniref:hypothetical protein n=1 Tax=Streptomyces sp. SID3343 TaxID=2690260 RepID=UPI00136EC809|nr:hypothetical protein [Streptomyces sp. SID3343]
MGMVDGRDAMGGMAAWVAAGGFGAVDVPGLLGLCAFTPNRKVGRGIDGGT